MYEVKVLAPATVSNVVCGFDCLGFALDGPTDELTLRRIEGREIRIVHHDDFGLSEDPESNVTGVALKAFIDAADIDFGFEVEIMKNIRPGSGVGSSAASSCGAVVAANHLIGGRFSDSELVELAMAGEMIASGSRHADNLAPCIFGGFTLVRSSQPVDIVSVSHSQLYTVVLHPQVEIKTSEARSILPADIPLKEAIRNWSNLGAFVAALANDDHALLSRSMVDNIIEPIRKRAIPGFDELKLAGVEAGAIGGGISGSGPSVFMLCSSLSTAQNVEIAMRHTYDRIGIDYRTYVSAISSKGVCIA